MSGARGANNGRRCGAKSRRSLGSVANPYGLLLCCVVAFGCGDPEIESPVSAPASQAAPTSPTVTRPTSATSLSAPIANTPVDPSGAVATHASGTPTTPDNLGAAGSAATTRPSSSASVPSMAGGPATPDSAPGATPQILASSPTVPANDEVAWPADCEERHVFRAHGNQEAGDTTKYRIAAGAQLVTTFYFHAPWTQDMQLLKGHMTFDNKKIVHHWVLWATSMSTAQEGSFAGAVGKDTVALGGEQYVVGGGPGATDVEMPANVGLRMPTGTNLLFELEVHYSNTVGETDEEDASSVEVCVTSHKRPVEAAVHTLGRASFSLPAHTQTDITSTCVPSGLDEPVHIMAVTPHMHLTGERAKLVLNHKSGDALTLVDNPYTFQEQKSYVVPEDRSAVDILVNPGDTLTSTCSFDNTTDVTINQGVRSENEMCNIGVLAWPAGKLHNSVGDVLGILPETGGLADVACFDP
jgi:hypothetical protein